MTRLSDVQRVAHKLRCVHTEGRSPSLKKTNRLVLDGEAPGSKCQVEHVCLCVCVHVLQVFPGYWMPSLTQTRPEQSYAGVYVALSLCFGNNLLSCVTEIIFLFELKYIYIYFKDLQRCLFVRQHESPLT